ncbi:alpha/beta hydrolase [Asticcacaulis sp. AND118]|uniref:alpha/beta hydrolase n=1 Tax=Asticcacaulis sp. AND118 TaxID=2840468 RepID=UPI001CFFF4C1|nr:alpha/beta hydrolase [Asticcacaulis sp. AND118]UDF04234.1 alpha/beta hydrolase [Asticcacaulis sp. AND118]
MWFLNLRSESGPSASVPKLAQAHLLKIEVADGKVIATTGGGMKPIPLAALGAQARNRRLVFVTHGYNVTLRNGLNALAGVRQFLNLDDTYLVVGVLWPGESTTMLNYVWEHQDAMQAGRVLAEFIDAYCADALEVNFISHSLGGRLGLECLRTVKRRLREVCLTAPAVNADAFAKRYKGMEVKAERISILASKADKILMLAYPPGNFAATAFGDIDAPLMAALGRIGAKPRPANVANYQIPSTFLWLDKGVDRNFDHMDYYPGQTMRTPPHVQLPLPGDRNNARPAHAARNSLWQLMTHALPGWPK